MGHYRHTRHLLFGFSYEARVLVCGYGAMGLLAIMWCLGLICGHVLVSVRREKCVSLVVSPRFFRGLFIGASVHSRRRCLRMWAHVESGANMENSVMKMSTYHYVGTVVCNGKCMRQYPTI
jgi:hypothetical protein